MMAEGSTVPGRDRGLKVLVTAASMHGGTTEIAQAIGQALCERGLAVTVIAPEDVGAVDGL